MDTTQILLGSPLLFDLNDKNFGKSNTCMFIFHGKKIMLIPSPPKNLFENKKNGSVTRKQGHKALVLCSIWSSNFCSMHNVLCGSIISEPSTSSTSTIIITMGTPNSGYLVMDLFDLHVFILVERFARYGDG